MLKFFYNFWCFGSFCIYILLVDSILIINRVFNFFLIDYVFFENRNESFVIFIIFYDW